MHGSAKTACADGIMNNTIPFPSDLGRQYPRGTLRYMTDDESLAARLEDLATEIGTVVGSGEGTLDIEVTDGGEDAACLLLGYSLPPADQDRVFVVVEGTPRMITTLRVLLSRCRHSWFLELLESGTWSSHFQPVVRLADRSTIGYEGLLRAQQGDGKPVSPAFALTAARATGKLNEFDRRARRAALENSCSVVPAEMQLFVNLDAGSIRGDEELDEIDEIVSSCQRRPENIVFEFLESESLAESPNVSWLRDALQERGFKVALDDLTSGFSTLAVLDRLRPDIAKLDQRLVRGAWSDRYRSRLVKAFVDLCRDLEMPLIIEGVEAREDYEFVRDLGAELAQGYFFSD